MHPPLQALLALVVAVATAGAPSADRATPLHTPSQAIGLPLRAASGPLVSPPRVGLVPGTTLGATVPISVSWPAASSSAGTPTRYELSRYDAATGWTEVALAARLQLATRTTVARGVPQRFAVRAADTTPSGSGWAAGGPLVARVVPESSRAIVYRGAWAVARSVSYDGSVARSTRARGASATYSFVGSGIGWVAAKSPIRGLARVSIDGKLAGTVSTFARTTVARRVVFARTWAAVGRHTIRIVALGTAGHPRIDVDAFVVLGRASGAAVAPPDGAWAPEAPRNLRATGSDGTVTLAWSAPAWDGGAPIKGYSVFRDGVFVGNASGGATYTAGGLANGRTYRFAVSAWNSVGGGVHTADVAATPEASVPAGHAGDPPGWTLVFSDDFSTDIARGSFEAATRGRYFPYQRNWHDTSGNGTYSPDIIAVGNGLLDIAIATVNGVHKVAAIRVLPPGRLSDTGDLDGMRVEYRLRADRMPGYKGVPLLWPMSQDWPRDGEINFPESNFDAAPRAYMHRQGGTTGGDQDFYTTPAGTSWQDWHTYAIEWVPGVSCEFFLDGVSIGRSTSRVPAGPMHLDLQFETQLSGGAPANSVSGHVQIDYVRVWALNR